MVCSSFSPQNIAPIILTLKRQTIYIFSAHFNALNAKYYVITTALLLPQVKMCLLQTTPVFYSGAKDLMQEKN